MIGDFNFFLLLTKFENFLLLALMNYRVVHVGMIFFLYFLLLLFLFDKCSTLFGAHGCSIRGYNLAIVSYFWFNLVAWKFVVFILLLGILSGFY